MICTKRPEEIIEFLKTIIREMRFGRILMDNGREFQNVKITNWPRVKEIKAEYSTSYYHERNGRIERATGPLEMHLKEIEVYYI